MKLWSWLRRNTVCWHYWDIENTTTLRCRNCGREKPWRDAWTPRERGLILNDMGAFSLPAPSDNDGQAAPGSR